MAVNVEYFWEISQEFSVKYIVLQHGTGVDFPKNSMGTLALECYNVCIQ